MIATIYTADNLIVSTLAINIEVISVRRVTDINEIITIVGQAILINLCGVQTITKDICFLIIEVVEDFITLVAVDVDVITLQVVAADDLIVTVAAVNVRVALDVVTSVDDIVSSVCHVVAWVLGSVVDSLTPVIL